MRHASLRHVAMRLACLNAGDREWVIEQLPAEERARVGVLLDEIADLALDRDPSVLDLLACAREDQDCLDSVVINDVALSVRIEKAGHPFWGALLLLELDEAGRQRFLTLSPQGGVLRRWDQMLKSHVVPPALMAELERQLADQAGGQYVPA